MNANITEQVKNILQQEFMKFIEDNKLVEKITAEAVKKDQIVIKRPGCKDVVFNIKPKFLPSVIELKHDVPVILNDLKLINAINENDQTIVCEDIEAHNEKQSLFAYDLSNFVIDNEQLVKNIRYVAETHCKKRNPLLTKIMNLQQTIPIDMLDLSKSFNNMHPLGAEKYMEIGKWVNRFNEQLSNINMTFKLMLLGEKNDETIIVMTSEFHEIAKNLRDFVHDVLKEYAVLFA